MSERRCEFASIKFAWAGVLLAALCLAPPSVAQGQTGAAAAGDASGHAQNSPAAKTPANGSSSGSDANSGSSPGSGASANSNGTASSSNRSAASGRSGAGSSAEPEMVDQSAPAVDSLAEAARQARARKAKAAAGAGANAPKVYTEDKLSQLSGHGVSVVGDGNAGGSGPSSSEESSYSEVGAGSGGSAAAGAGSNGEEYWRGKAKAIRDQMAQCDQEISKLQDEIAKYGAVSVDPQSGAMQSIIYVNDRNAKIKQIQDRKDSLQGQLDALEDEGRKAGADAGWFR